MRGVLLASPLVSRQHVPLRCSPLAQSAALFSTTVCAFCVPLLSGTITPSKLFPLPAHRPTTTLRTPLLYRSRFLTESSLRKPQTAKASLPSPPSSPQSTENPPTLVSTIRENIYTIPNALTISRILACPVLGWAIVKGDFVLATSLLAYAGVTDWVDGFVARKYNMRTVLGTILDPAADKALMTTLTVTLAVKGLLPLPLAITILGRDILLSLSAFYIRYKSLPAPKTFARYWDFSIPSAEVRPTAISKINTALQLLLMTCTTVSPLLHIDVHTPLLAFQWIVAGTTIWSGVGYLFSQDAVRYIGRSPTSAMPK